MTSRMPYARKEGLVIQDLPPDEMLVYDLSRHRAHCLNRMARVVWQQCDGHRPVVEVTALLQSELNPAATEEWVWLALARLRKADLLQEDVSLPPLAIRISRRDFVRRVGVAGGLALLPLITSMRVPLVAEAQSQGGTIPGPYIPPPPTATSPSQPIGPLVTPTNTTMPPPPPLVTATSQPSATVPPPPLVTATVQPSATAPPPTATNTAAPPTATQPPACLPAGSPCTPTGGTPCCSGGCTFDRGTGSYRCP